MDEFDTEITSTLPPFANEENKQLHQKILNQENVLANVENELESITERTSELASHMKNVEAEYSHTQQIYTARVEEMENEEHHIQLMIRERGKLEIEKKKISSNIEDIEDKINSIENRIFLQNEKLHKYRDQYEINQEDLDSWFSLIQQKLEDLKILEQYKAKDASLEKDRELKISKITEAIIELRQKLDNEVLQTKFQQAQLDKLNQQFKNSHVERRDVIAKWQATVNEMVKLDQEIAVRTEKFNDNKKILRERKNFLDTKRKLANTEESTLKEQNNENQRLLKERYNYNEDLSRLTKQIEDLQHEKNINLQQYEKLEKEVINQRNMGNQLQKEIDRSVKNKDKRQKDFEQKKDELAQLESSNLAEEEKLKILEEMIAENESAIAEADKVLNNLTTKLFKSNQELYDLKTKEKHLLTDLQSLDTSIKNADQSIHQQELESQRQEELIYQSDFQIQHLERRLARAQGKRSEEEKKQLNSKITSLQTELDGVEAREKSIKKSLSDVEEAINRQKMKITKLQKEEEILEMKKNELNLGITKSQKTLNKISIEKQEKFVEENNYSLQKVQLQETLEHVLNLLTGYANRKEQLRLHIDERKIDIAAHQDILKSELKSAEQERRKYAVNLNEKTLLSEKLQNKFDTITNKGIPSDIPAEEHSQAFFVVKAAQEKQELQQLGDELDEAIRVLIKEIQQLELTKDQLGAANSNYKSNLTGTSDGNKVEKATKEAYETELSEINLKTRQLMDKRSEVEAELHYQIQMMNDLRNDNERLLQDNEETSGRLEQLRKEVDDQEDKLGRATALLTRAKKGCIQSLPKNEAAEIELELQAQELRNANSDVLKALTRISTSNSIIGPTLAEALSQMFGSSRPSSSRTSNRSRLQ
eukprot:TRINITY_DN1853_c0_g1_i1.p1 TRINITY_DN1853_c0_g1~~TRINITY_DN1853_c0_g1_i1.p1  ORF type:complete len:880 (-),score=305.36 TRINITY_DN1853_c0_g1_i1:32-2671(-)